MSSLDCLSVGLLVADHLCDPIDHLPAAGELILAERLPLAIGGCAANVAIDLAKLGVRVGAVGCVGRDLFGRYVADTLRTGGVETSEVHELEGIGTSGTLIVNVRGEDRRFIHTVGANARLTTEHVSLDRLRQAKVFYVGGFLLLAALDPEKLAEQFRLARAAGVKTVLDIVLPGPGEHMAKLAPVLAHTDVFLPNTDEAAIITGLTDPLQQAEHFLNAGARTVAITCGGEGSVLVTDNLRLRAGIFPMEYRGGTGSGDAFDAGYIVGLIEGLDPIGCLNWGAAIGASCVRSVSATESVFSRVEAEAFLRDNSLHIERI